tara:strand:+ start:453 stop:959 length:507 start_codon:yes stop_codon:yes gene_type:complete
MANRILIGSRATGGYGLYVGKSGQNVLTTTEPMQFDSRMGASAIVQSFGQNSISAGSTSDFTHNLGYNPLFAVRWNLPSDLSSGVAQRVYTPAFSDSDIEEIDEDRDETIFEAEVGFGIRVSHLNTNTIRLENYFSVDNGDLSGETPPTLYYAIVVFHEADYTGGTGL